MGAFWISKQDPGCSHFSSTHCADWAAMCFIWARLSTVLQKWEFFNCSHCKIITTCQSFFSIFFCYTPIFGGIGAPHTCSRHFYCVLGLQANHKQEAVQDWIIDCWAVHGLATITVNTSSFQLLIDQVSRYLDIKLLTQRASPAKISLKVRPWESFKTNLKPALCL